MISIAYQTEFTNCKRLVSIYAGYGGTACVRVRRTNTYEVCQGVVTDVHNNVFLCRPERRT